MSNHRDTSRQLRNLKIFSGNDQFMQNGHQIINRNLANAGAPRKNADWAKDDKSVQALLKRVFPKCASDPEQRKRAGRWIRIIHLHYRSGLSYGDTAAEMGVTVATVRSALQHMRRAVKGFPCNRSIKSKKSATFRTSLGVSSEETD